MILASEVLSDYLHVNHITLLSPSHDHCHKERCVIQSPRSCVTTWLVNNVMPIELHLITIGCLEGQSLIFVAPSL